MSIQITVSDLTEKVNSGMKRDALAAHYGLSKVQMSNVLRQAGLKIRKFHAPKFELVNDVTVGTTEVEEVEQVSTTTMEEVATEMPETPTVEGSTAPPALQEGW